MDAPPTAELLPDLYRQVLDAVAALAREGHRRDADRIRAQAARAYAHAWDASAARRLTRLNQRARRVLDGGLPPRRERPWDAILRRLAFKRTTA